MIKCVSGHSKTSFVNKVFSISPISKRKRDRTKKPASSLLISFWLWRLVVWIRILLRTLISNPNQESRPRSPPEGISGHRRQLSKSGSEIEKRVAVTGEFRQCPLPNAWMLYRWEKRSESCRAVCSGAIKQKMMSKYGRECLWSDCDHDFGESNAICHLFKGVIIIIIRDMKWDEPNGLCLSFLYALLCLTFKRMLWCST